MNSRKYMVAALKKAEKLGMQLAQPLLVPSSLRCICIFKGFIPIV